MIAVITTARGVITGLELRAPIFPDLGFSMTASLGVFEWWSTTIEGTGAEIAGGVVLGDRFQDEFLAQVHGRA